MSPKRKLQSTLGIVVVCAVALTGTIREAHGADKKSPSVATKTAPPKAAPATKPGGTKPAAPGTLATRPDPGPHPAPATSRPSVYHPLPNIAPQKLPGGRVQYHNPNGQTVTTDAGGKIRTIESSPGFAGKTVINRSARGGRTVVTGNPGARTVSSGPGRGFVERAVPGRPGYISRTYVANGRSYARVYREFRYGNARYYGYVRGVFYSPRFYDWAVAPWDAPMRYAWFGFTEPAPWFGFYAGYFSPYPMYPSADLWLTDYVIAQNMRSSYENRPTDADPSVLPSSDLQSSTSELSPEMKAQIAAEVRQQIEVAKAATANSGQPAAALEQPPAALDPKVLAFVVSNPLDVTAGDQMCSLTGGDILMRTGNTPDANQSVPALVTASKKSDCPIGTSVAVSVQDLQEMHNQFQEQLDSGLKMLAANQVKGAPNVSASGAHPSSEGAADPASDAAAQLATQETNASKLEADVRQSAS